MVNCTILFNEYYFFLKHEVICRHAVCNTQHVLFCFALFQEAMKPLGKPDKQPAVIEHPMWIGQHSQGYLKM